MNGSTVGNFRKNGLLDPDLFAGFVRQKVYLRYAEPYLAAVQIAEVATATPTAIG